MNVQSQLWISVCLNAGTYLSARFRVLDPGGEAVQVAAAYLLQSGAAYKPQFSPTLP